MSDYIEDDPFYVHDKEGGYHYRWANMKDHIMRKRIREGYEVVKGSEYPELPILVQQMGQVIESPGGGQVRTRGDLVLMRMPEDRFESRVRRPKEAARERQQITVKSMVESANDSARAALKQLHPNNVPPNMVFDDGTADAKIGGGKVKEA